MNKKSIIQVVVIVGAFVGSGIVLYNGLFKSTGVPPPLQGVNSTAISEEKILPYGDKFNYQVMSDMQKRNFSFGAVDYPKVDPSEIGKASLDDLIQAPAAGGMPSPSPTKVPIKTTK